MPTLKDIQEKRKYPQEMLLMSGCPSCGLETNRVFVENIIDEITTLAFQGGEKSKEDMVLKEIDGMNETVKEYVGIGQWFGNWQNTPLVNEEDVYKILSSLKEKIISNSK